MACRRYERVRNGRRFYSLEAPNQSSTSSSLLLTFAFVPEKLRADFRAKGRLLHSKMNPSDFFESLPQISVYCQLRGCLDHVIQPDVCLVGFVWYSIDRE